MPTLVIRNFDDLLECRLRERAAANNRSVEEEARLILRAALPESFAPGSDLGTRIRARFAGLGDVQLQIDPRDPGIQPPSL